MITPLTLEMARELAGNLSERHHYELTGLQPDLEQWAIERCTFPGSAWAILVGGRVEMAGGVIDIRSTGTVWLAGRDGWTRYVKQALRIWRLILGLEKYPYTRLECECYEDNTVARRFVERLGFKEVGKLECCTLRGENLIEYGMVP